MRRPTAFAGGGKQGRQPCAQKAPDRHALPQRKDGRDRHPGGQGVRHEDQGGDTGQVWLVNAVWLVCVVQRKDGRDRHLGGQARPPTFTPTRRRRPKARLVGVQVTRLLASVRTATLVVSVRVTTAAGALDSSGVRTGTCL
eukprot:365468-Chlamydomonas_euryale.AAC.11